MMIKLNGLPLDDHDFDVATTIFFSKKARRLQVGAEHKSRTPSEYKWGDVCGRAGVEGEEEERAFDEEDAKSRILSGSAPPDAAQANSEKAAEKVNKLNAEGLKQKAEQAKSARGEREGGRKEEEASSKPRTPFFLQVLSRGIV